MVSETPLLVDGGMNEEPSVKIARKVAAYTNTSITELPPLGESIDANALDKLVDSMPDGKVIFPYADYRVTVISDGGVDIEPRDSD